MPTYAYECDSCDDYFHVWESIHANSQTMCGRCGGRVVRVIEQVATYGVGDRGANTRMADAREARLDVDRPAYRRLRDEGHQPLAVTGAAELEARASNAWEIKTGMRVSVPAEKEAEVGERMATASLSGWSPVEQVHHERSA